MQLVLECELIRVVNPDPERVLFDTVTKKLLHLKLMWWSWVVETLEKKIKQDKLIHKLFHCWILLQLFCVTDMINNVRVSEWYARITRKSLTDLPWIDTKCCFSDRYMITGLVWVQYVTRRKKDRMSKNLCSPRVSWYVWLVTEKLERESGLALFQKSCVDELCDGSRVSEKPLSHGREGCKP